MTELDLFDELTFLEDDLILEAHEVPARKIIRFRGLRRVAVLVAAVMTVIALSLSAVAGDWDVTPMSIYEKYAEDGNSWRDIGRRGNCYGVRCQEFEYNETIYQLNHSYVYTTTSAQTYTVCEEGYMIVRLEAMVLMPDNRVEYKYVRSEGEGPISLSLDHMVDGEAGILIHVRATTYIPDTSIMSQTSKYLPHDLGFDLPVGTDARFPDSRFNYDGRG